MAGEAGEATGRIDGGVAGRRRGGGVARTLDALLQGVSTPRRRVTGAKKERPEFETGELVGVRWRGWVLEKISKLNPKTISGNPKGCATFLTRKHFLYCMKV